MSGISSVGGCGSDSYALWLRQIARQSSGDCSTVQQASSSATAAGAAETTGGSESSDSLDDLLSQILAAIQSALQQADTSGSGNDSNDVRQTIKNAIDETLQANGIDPAQFQPGMRPPLDGTSGTMPSGMGPPPGMAPPAGMGPPPDGVDATNAVAESAGNLGTTESATSTQDSTVTDAASDPTNSLDQLLQTLFSSLGNNNSGSGVLVGIMFDVQA